MKSARELRLFRRAQASEVEYWTAAAESLNDPQLNSWKVGFWQEYLAAMGWDLEEKARQYGPPVRCLAVGCGPRGVPVLLAKHSDKFKVTGLDPLMDKYLALGPWLRDLDVTWIDEAFEEFDAREPFDVVFALNVIDHCRDQERFAERLGCAVAPDGEVWVSVNCHTKAWRAWIWQNLALDENHPYHHTEAQYAALLGRHFHVKSVRDTTTSLFKCMSSPARPRGAPQTRKMRSIFNPKAWLRKALTLGTPGFPQRPDQKSCYRTKAFELVPRA